MPPRQLKYGVWSSAVLYEVDSSISLGDEAYIEPPTNPERFHVQPRSVDGRTPGRDLLNTITPVRR